MPIYEKGAAYVEQLNYSNPLGLDTYPIWFNTERYWAVDTHTPIYFTVKESPATKEYRFYYGAPDNPGAVVAGQLPIYSEIPGSVHYSPIVEVMVVFVPRDYEVNSIRSERGIQKTDYPIVATGRYYDRPVL